MSRFENKDFSSLAPDDGPAPPYSGLAPGQGAPPPLPQMDTYGYDQPRDRGQLQPVVGGQPLNQSQQVVVMQGQPQQTMGIVVQSPPTDWTIPAILSCICCFWPTGIFAIIFANKAMSSFGRLDYEGAKSSATVAKVLTLTTIAIGVIGVIVMVVAVVTVANAAENNHDYNLGNDHANKIGNDLGNLGNDLSGALNDLVSTTRKPLFPFK